MTRGEGVAWGSLAAGGAVLGVVLGLLQNTLRPVLEIRRYADDIEEAAENIVANVGGVEDLLATKELAVAVPALAVAYLQRLGKAPA